MKKFDDIWKKANEEAELNYEPKGTISLLVFFKEALEKRIEPLLEKQQPEIPEFVAEYITKLKKANNNLAFAFSSRVNECPAKYWNEAILWLFTNPEEFAQAWINGYTVAKEKRFYLKHIDMSKKYNSTVCVLAHGEGDVIYGHYEFPVGVFPSESDYIFTQSQIDSMETGSYEQITVEENK
ncbi:DUF1642 domain-containing protein [Lactococcus garvieae]|uniref:DUF1642 domain-containing protein n=1 Tax=Lactococcus garvieae TaxID=1363 RepID=UPI001F614B50|nr:DUF1642 domain-containing protein [Lactococcus garvieae]MCI3860098.1 DUF1642 domain-containing protein [Lactococcus garvieae]